MTCTKLRSPIASTVHMTDDIMRKALRRAAAWVHPAYLIQMAATSTVEVIALIMRKGKNNVPHLIIEMAACSQEADRPGGTL